VKIMGHAKKTWVKPQLTRLQLTPKEIEVLFPEAGAARRDCRGDRNFGAAA
jgi:hypothetical protein